MPEFIPPFSLDRQNAALAAEVEAAALRVLRSGRYAQGPECEAFEREIAPWVGGARAVTCSSGTDALHLALRAVGVAAGDVVLTTPFTFFATAGAILLAGAVPEFVDIDAGTFNLSPKALSEALARPRTRRIGAIIAVHLYGRLADMPAILKSAGDIPVVEDAAQAIGASLVGRPAGAWGAAAAFSFYPTKNLGAMGEGGLVTTMRPEVEAKLRLLRAHGSPRRYAHDILGWNGRMHELQAAILRVKLPHLAGWNQRRAQIAAEYGLTPVVAGHIYHQYVIRSSRRDALRDHMRELQVGSEVYYPTPLDCQPALAAYGNGAPCPESLRASQEVVALPMFPELSVDEVRRVREAFRSFS
ncbi:MAG TPA: DegT/DnrJ/EryC1/StrS family aminotransferase [Terriglobales bacterium]